MTDFEQNILSASIISVIIGAMAILKSNRLKALIYSLPIPIIVTLVAMGGAVNANHVVGLLLANLFLWGVYVLNKRANFNIFFSDIIVALAYIGTGYALTQTINISFYWSASIYLTIWLVFIFLYKPEKAQKDSEQTEKISPIIKLAVVFLLAFLLFSLKNYLSGIIVTFPFSGVFAVVEGRHMLKTLAATFARNSLAILAMFITLYFFKDIHPGIRMALSWIVYFVILKLITSAFPLSIHNPVKSGEKAV